MNIDLLRQRRNLIVTSSALLLFDFAKVTITKIGIMGTELLIGDVRVLVYFSWAVWAYFLLRYYQYLRAEGDLRIFADFKMQFERWSQQYVFQKINKTSITGNIEYKWKGLRSHYAVNEYDTAHGKVKTTNSGTLPPWKTIWWVLRSIYYIAVHTSKATDHILPFFLAIPAPIVSIIKAV